MQVMKQRGAYNLNNRLFSQFAFCLLWAGTWCGLAPPRASSSATRVSSPPRRLGFLTCRASAGLSLALIPPVLLGFLSCRAKIQGILSCFTHSSILALVEPAPWLDEAVCYKYAGAIRLGDYAGVAWNSFPQIMSHLASSIWKEIEHGCIKI